MTKVSKLTHLTDQGAAHMVDVGNKPVTTRAATAHGMLMMKPDTLKLVLSGMTPKGDIFAAARIAGIMAAKKTHELIPLCHALPLAQVDIDIHASEEDCALIVRAKVKTTAQTGVEMEALTAVSAACLTLYDMMKSADRSMRIERIYLEEKTGGQSGHFRFADDKP